MIPQQNVVAFPEFSNAGTKIAPDAAKYAAGFQQSDVLPAEWLNYFLNKTSAGQTVNNAIVDSIQKELQNVVSKSGQTPTEGDNQQVFKAIRSYIATKTNTMICNTDVDESPAVTGYDYINEYYDGLSVEVLFKNGHYGANSSANLTFEIGELGAKKVYTPKDGETVLVKSNSVDRGDGYGTKNWFMQPFTSLKMMYDSSLDDNAGGWVILENAVVLSDSSSPSSYTIYADGKTIYNKRLYYNVSIPESYFSRTYIRNAILSNIGSFGDCSFVSVKDSAGQTLIVNLDKRDNNYFYFTVNSYYLTIKEKYNNGQWISEE